MQNKASKAVSKAGYWLFYALVVHAMYGAFLSRFATFPEWANAPVDWLIYALEASPEDVEGVAVSFLAAVHLIIIAVVAALVCLGIKLWMPPEKASEILGRLLKLARRFLVGFVVIMALYCLIYGVLMFAEGWLVAVMAVVIVLTCLSISREKYSAAVTFARRFLIGLAFAVALANLSLFIP